LTILLIFFSINSFAQIKNPGYASQWKKTDELVKKGLTKSAVEQVNKIYIMAKKDKNDPQIIKALLYQVSLKQNIEEDANVRSIAAIEKEISTAKSPAKSILHSIAAEKYWNFFQQNRWKIYNRTNTENFIKADIETWNADDFHKKIGGLYMSSIKEEKLLQQTKLDKFDPILIKGNVRYLRPTLYDLLAHRALEYFKSEERDINRPAYAFEIKDEKVFTPAAEFAFHKVINKDSASLHYYAIIIHQKLLSFHITDVKPEALIDADISRIEFAKQYGVMNNKDELYIKSLKNITTTFANNAASAQAGYLVALEIFNKANEVNKTNVDSVSKYTITEAKGIADSVVKKFPESEGGINAKNLLIQILHKQINLASEKVSVPGQPFRSLVSYKNISSINLRIIELTPEFKKLLEQSDNYDNDNDRLWRKLTGQKFIKSWKQELPVVNDYRSHSVEIKIDTLPVGQYALLSSVAEDFILNKNPLAVQYFHVSDISYVNNGFEYFVLNRETGKPLAGAKVQVWKQEYDYKSSKNVLTKQEFVTADKNGYFKIAEKVKDAKGKIQNENRNIRLEITYQKDRLFLDDYQNSSKYYNNEDDDADDYNINDAEDVKDYEEEKTKIFLFTDRSIYRPGQLVYFKGIGVTRDLETRKSKLLLSKDSLTVVLTDANNQEVDSIKVLLNEYGSLNGKFRLPENKLNGEFEIKVGDFENASTAFSVEEYKRPKFYTEFEKVKGTYRVNDKVKISGFAKAYAGNNIDDAKVKYRVTRVARFLYPWMFWRWPMPQTQPLEITSGEIKTGTDGKFSIEFEAVPDLSIDKKTDPVFDYKVEADVTDINGETRSASIVVPIGYKALDLQITLPQPVAINVDSLKEMFVSSKNLSGEFEPTKVDIKIYALQTPQRLIRNRYWEQPDQFIMSNEEFLKYFPNDEYKDENKKETWSKGQLIFSKTESTKPTGKGQLVTGNFQQGWYVAEATAKDKYGEDVKDVKYFQLYDLKAASLPVPAYTWNATIKNTVEPGEKAQFISGTSADDIFLIQQIGKQIRNKEPRPVDVLSGQAGTENQYQFYQLNNEKKTFEFPVAEEDRGGFGVYQFFVKNNRIYSNTWNVNVPWTNKQLDITYQTFRDKTLPGSEEKWKVKISGSKGEKVGAEMVASMYDASLDQFKPHNWNILNVWPNYFSYNGWASVQNFTSIRSIERWINEEYVQQKEKTYDALIFVEDSAIPLRIRGVSSREYEAAPSMDKNANQDVVVQALSEKSGGIQVVTVNGEKDEAVVAPTIEKKQTSIDPSQIQIRKNFNETVFFFPELRTAKDGNIEFSFTMPEALTQWKLMTLAHTKDLASGYSEKTVVTQKQLMVQPSAPRFVREGDNMEFSAKIVNLDTSKISGQAQLQLLNASTMNPVDDMFKNNLPLQSFTVEAGQSTAVKFNIEIPVNYNSALVYRIVAKAGENSDGEEAVIPVLTNRMLVTETMPLALKDNNTKNLSFEKLLHSGN
ncbi:MAG: alpha-2-macroglobulin family protein, partial [Ginsengibacter sp.]